jgi:hypothetical protein
MILFEKKKAKSPDLGDPFLLWQGAKSNIEISCLFEKWARQGGSGSKGRYSRTQNCYYSPQNASQVIRPALFAFMPAPKYHLG